MRSHFIRLTGLALLVVPPPVSAQVVRDVADLHLDYMILLNEETAPIGTCEVAFERVDTKRGPRLRVTETADYTLPLTTPFRYRESVEVFCDEEGVERFEAETAAGETEKKHVGFRAADQYHVTTTPATGEATEQRFPDDVLRSNLGMFCGAFLVERLDTDDMLREFPMLWPAQGTRYPRQKFRESIMPFQISADRRVRSITSTLRKDNKIPIVDRYYHSANDHMILLRMEQENDLGVITYELTAVNGVPLAESDLLD